MDLALLEEYDLGRFASILSRYEKPAIAFWLSDAPAQSISKLGGLPLLPAGFEWPRNKDRPLDFLLQIDCREVSPLDPYNLLPRSGLLTFFYDLEEQPWGYDPRELDGYRVMLLDEDGCVPTPLPTSEYQLPERMLRFGPGLTLPQTGSRDYDRLEVAAKLGDKEWDNYF